MVLSFNLQRYKICQYHSQLDYIVINGQAIRFCQQCGRFHELDQFEGDRRSCRAKLERHNDRRRKMLESQAETTLESDESRRSLQDNHDLDDIPVHFDRSTVGSHPVHKPFAQRKDMSGLVSELMAMRQRQQYSSRMPSAPENSNGEIRSSYDGGHERRMQPSASGFEYYGPFSGANASRMNIPESDASKSLIGSLLSSMVSAARPTRDLDASTGHPQVTEQSPYSHAEIFPSEQTGYEQSAMHSQNGAANILQLAQAMSSRQIPPSLLNLLQHVAAGAVKPTALPQQDVYTVAVKFFNATPEQLPEGLVSELKTWMIHNPTYMEVAARPGCVHLHVHAMLSLEEVRQARVSLEEQLQTILDSPECTSNEKLMCTMQVAGEQRAKSISRKGSLGMIIEMTPASKTLQQDPAVQIDMVRPLAVTKEYEEAFVLVGNDIRRSDVIHCISRSVHETVEVEKVQTISLSSLPSEREMIASANEKREGAIRSVGWAKVRVPHLQNGAYMFEVQRGIYTSAPATFVVLDDDEMVKEVRELEHDTSYVFNLASFLFDVGIIYRLSLALAEHNGDLQAAAMDVDVPSSAMYRFKQIARDIVPVCLLRGWTNLLACALAVASVETAKSDTALVLQSNLLTSLKLTPLQAAILSGNIGTVRALLAWTISRNCMLSLDDFSGSADSTPFHLAALASDQFGASIVNLLLDTFTKESVLEALAVDDCGIIGKTMSSLLTLAIGIHRPRVLKALEALDVQRVSEEVNAIQKLTDIGTEATSSFECGVLQDRTGPTMSLSSVIDVRKIEDVPGADIKSCDAAIGSSAIYFVPKYSYFLLILIQHIMLTSIALVVPFPQTLVVTLIPAIPIVASCCLSMRDLSGFPRCCEVMLNVVWAALTLILAKVHRELLSKSLRADSSADVDNWHSSSGVLLKLCMCVSLVSLLLALPVCIKGQSTSPRR